MSEAEGFGISRQGVLDFSDSLGDADELADGFPAPLVASVWRALLTAGVIETPARVIADRIEVWPVGPHALELRVPVRTGLMEFVKAVPVHVPKWPATGELENQVADEAERLVRALERAGDIAVVQHSPGQTQKPHN